MSTTNPSNKLRFILSGGGTGGHIFPAVAIANELQNRFGENATILFVGALGKMEMSKVPQAGYEIIGLPIEGLKRSLSPRNFIVAIKTIISFIKARKIINKFKPNAVIGTGGYASLPVCYMASKMGIPVFLQEQNGFAGLTNKIVGKNAVTTCTGFPDMGKFFPGGNWIFTGNPVRKNIIDSANVYHQSPEKTKEEAAQKFGFTTEKPVLFITGGSLGARTINESIANGLPALTQAGIQVIWQMGERFWDANQCAISEKIDQLEAENGQKPAILFSAFLNNMDEAYQAADLVVARSGAITISELCILAKPAILIPSPNVTDDHQTKNAQVLSNRHAAVLIPDKNCEVELIPTILDLIHNQDKKKQMCEQLMALAKPDATSQIVDILTKHISNK